MDQYQFRSLCEAYQNVYQVEEVEDSHIDEEIDLYDVILNHLLDEGYCDDVESAEIIMANMSEEWRNEILEALDATDIKNREEVEKELRAYRTATPEQKKHIMARINERLPGGAGNQQNKPRTRRITYEVK